MATINLEKTMPEEFYHEPKSGRSHLTKTILLIAAFVIVFIAGIFGGVWYYQHRVTQTTDIKSDQVAVSSTLPVQDNTTNNSTVQWNGSPVALPDLKLVTEYKDDLNNYSADYTSSTIDGYPTADRISYYDMGLRGASKVVLVVVRFLGPGEADNMFFFEQSASGYTFMQKNSSDYIYGFAGSDNETNIGYVLSSQLIATDSTTVYDSGVFGPEKINYQGLDLIRSSDRIGGHNYRGILFDTAFAGNSIIKKDAVTGGDLYLLASDEGELLTSMKYVVKLPSGLYDWYDLVYNFFSDDSIPFITWTDGAKNTDPYRRDGGLSGCGTAMDYVLAKKDISSDVKVTGTTEKGESIYEFKDLQHPIVKFFYGQATGGGESMTLAKWYAHHNVILYKNALGDYLIFSNEKYGLQAECGKPVVYLYPTKTTKVRVQVGADITKSEPAYSKGWQVTAEPSGKLTNTDGATYDSLFWEGLGHGAYPQITEGTIVSQSSLHSTIKTQLTELGLSVKESQDFMNFWLDKLPQTPYVRLTWFTTKQMDELAPLFVSPRPDSVIRIFLDFQGYQTKISLPEQKLSSIPRKGFTVIEWGGLLRK